MGCLKSLAKYILFIFNFLIALAALAFIVVGVIFKLNLDNEVFKDKEEIYRFQLAPILLIVIGCIVFFIAFLGCCGACKKSSCMLNTYGVILLVILALELALGIYAYIESEKTDLKDSVLKIFRQEIRKYPNNEAIREYVDTIQKNFKCCGVDGRSDWTGITPTIPASCGSEIRGCGNLLYESLKDNVKTVGIVANVICAIELLGSIFAFWVATKHKSGHYA